MSSFGVKKCLNFRFWPKNQTQFLFFFKSDLLFFFFFLEITCFWAEKSFEFPILAENSDSISVKTSFFLEITCFWAEKSFEFPILAENSDSISVKTFFFWRFPVFERKKHLNFRAFRELPSQFSNKPCKTDSRTMKIRVEVVCTFLTLSKKPPPPPFSKSWLRACSYGKSVLGYYYITFM